MSDNEQFWRAIVTGDAGVMRRATTPSPHPRCASLQDVPPAASTSDLFHGGHHPQKPLAIRPRIAVIIAGPQTIIISGGSAKIANSSHQLVRAHDDKTRHFGARLPHSGVRVERHVNYSDDGCRIRPARAREAGAEVVREPRGRH